MVAVHHTKAFSHFYPMALIRNDYLLLDFFFVLSGFVISANYQSRLLAGFGIGRFILLRVGRLYPLHLFMLLCFVMFELSKVAASHLGVQHDHPAFSAPGMDLLSLLSNVLLLHGLGFHDHLTWNAPSWSISTEFYTYVLFAMAVVCLRRKIWGGLLLIAILGPIFLFLFSPSYMDATYHWGFLRCVLGFAVGVMTFGFFQQFTKPDSRTLMLWIQVRSGWLPHAMEFLLVAAVLVWMTVWGAGPWSIAAPFVFAPVVLLFADQAGFVSGLLQRRWPLFLGAISYSIYMTHAFLLAIVETFLRLLERATGSHFFTLAVNTDGSEAVRFLGTTLWFGDLAYLIVLVLVVAVSTMTYRFVERPARDWCRRKLIDRDPILQKF